ncbi:hypothetical protein [Vibrio fluvialis]|nr:hypothetical protein [Vibrio fluvialis]
MKKLLLTALLSLSSFGAFAEVMICTSKTGHLAKRHIAVQS